MESESYFRARRVAAWAGAGLLALLAVVAFVYQLPSTFFPHVEGPPWLHWLAFAVFYMVYATISLPFDVWAGYWLPCRYQRSCRLLPVYLGTLFRAESAQFAVMTLSALALLEAGRRWGAPGALAACGAAQGVLLLLRPRLARYLGIEVRSLPASLWIPAAGWNLASLWLVLQLPWCGAGTVHHLVETLLGCALLTLPGYWLLRLWNRGAASAMLYLSWAGFGIFSRATSGRMGLPEQWLAPEPGSSLQEPSHVRAISQITST
jgi:hypothetical protein